MLAGSRGHPLIRHVSSEIKLARFTMTRVLYVEDNDDNVYMLKMRLELIEGYEIAVARDGAEAISSIVADPPDIILMDLNVPVLSGWEATRRLKADPKTAQIPIIALTAHAMTSDREKALAAGCDDFDTKPIDFERLLAKMRKLLSVTAAS
jgi:two-component system, cell cycle response regulator DivK